MYPEYIMKNVRQNLGLEENDTSMDKDIEVMSRKEVLERSLQWLGIIGYANRIISMVSDIYGVDLKG